MVGSRRSKRRRALGIGRERDGTCKGQVRKGEER